MSSPIALLILMALVSRGLPDLQEIFLADCVTPESRTPFEIRSAIIRGDWKTVALGLFLQVDPKPSCEFSARAACSLRARESKSFRFRLPSPGD